MNSTPAKTSTMRAMKKVKMENRKERKRKHGQEILWVSTMYDKMLSYILQKSFLLLIFFLIFKE